MWDMTFEEAVAAQEAGDFEAAERGYLALSGSRNAFYNLAILYRTLGRIGESERAYRLILAAYPDMAGAQRGLAMCLLAQGQYAEAWPLYEGRRKAQPTPDPLADFPEWQGESLAGKHIVVVAEQGAGDQLMFARFIPVLIERGAQVTVACDPRTIARLFERAGFQTTPFLRAGQRLPRADFWVFMASLPLRLNHPRPPAAGYLTMPGEGGGIGVMATGNPAHQNDAHRSLRGADAEALFRLGRDLSPDATGARDFDDSAQIMAGLDLVITVDSAVAHLAGAMGKRCWVLLPRLGMDWRWNMGSESDWHPQARLFRQTVAGDWSGVIERLRAEIDATCLTMGTKGE